MTDQELRKLNRIELLEMLLEQRKENLKLQEQTEQLRRELADRTIMINEAGSIADASMQLNGVFEAAERACAQYIDNVKLLSARQEEACMRREQETEKKCEDMVAEAKQKSQQYWDEASQKIQDLYNSYTDLRDLLNRLPQFEVREQIK